MTGLKPARLFRREQFGRAPVYVIKDRGRQIYTGASSDEARANMRLAQYLANPAAYLKWAAI